MSRPRFVPTVLLTASALFAGAAHAQSQEDPNLPTQRSQERPAEMGFERPAQPVQFALGSAEIDPQGDALIEEAAQWLRDHPDQRLVIEGHADHAGGEEYNVALSLRRATDVRDRLVELGADPEQLVVVVYGEVMPTSTEDARNRRVVFYGTTLTPEQVVMRTMPKAYSISSD